MHLGGTGRKSPAVQTLLKLHSREAFHSYASFLSEAIRLESTALKRKKVATSM
jgi:hypothetical protein